MDSALGHNSRRARPLRPERKGRLRSERRARSRVGSHGGHEDRSRSRFRILKASTELSAEWSKVTRSTVKIEAQREATTNLSYDVPADGMDIALWRLDSRLTRRLMLRPGKHLPPEPLPHWVDMAIAARASVVDIPTNITQAKTRMAGITPPAQLPDKISSYETSGWVGPAATWPL